MAVPCYVELFETGELSRRADVLRAHLKSCDLCPRMCGVDRTAGETGYCRVGDKAIVSSYGPHPGEEPELVGRHGSGTIFFASCNLLCVFCQNAEISHGMRGIAQTDEDVADKMLHLQSMGCHNINLVTPTHFVPQIVRAIDIAAASGLRLPIVYNCGGYERVPERPGLSRCSEGGCEGDAPPGRRFEGRCARHRDARPSGQAPGDAGGPCGVGGICEVHCGGGINQHLCEHHASVSSGA